MVELQIGNLTAYRNGEEITLQQEPVISQDRTLVPLRFVGEALGAQVTWDGETLTVYLTTK